MEGQGRADHRQPQRLCPGRPPVPPARQAPGASSRGSPRSGAGQDRPISATLAEVGASARRCAMPGLSGRPPQVDQDLVRADVGHSSIRSASATSPALISASVNCEPRGANLGANLARRPSQASQLGTSGFLRLSAGSSATGWCEPQVRRGATPGSHPSQHRKPGIPRLMADSVRL
jgi:hypothetical protein